MEIKLDSKFSVNGLYVQGSLHLRRGLNVLCGNNGIGKSTLFHYIKNNKKDFFPSHRLSFMDQFPLEPLSELRVKDIFNILEEDISYFDTEKLNSMIEKFDFTPLLERSVQLLSGGENQILKFILASSQKVEYYFLDEPLQYLDGKNLLLILDQIKELSDSATVILIEHRKEHLLKLEANWIQMTKNKEVIMIGDQDGI